MVLNINLSDAEVCLSQNDLDELWNIITENSENFLYMASNYIMSKLEDDFEYYFPHIEELYNKIKELNG